MRVSSWVWVVSGRAHHVVHSSGSLGKRRRPGQQRPSRPRPARRGPRSERDPQLRQPRRGRRRRRPQAPPRRGTTSGGPRPRHPRQSRGPVRGLPMGRARRRAARAPTLTPARVPSRRSGPRLTATACATRHISSWVDWDGPIPYAHSNAQTSACGQLCVGVDSKHASHNLTLSHASQHAAPVLCTPCCQEVAAGHSQAVATPSCAA